MDQVEARRRFEKKLVLKGYSMTGSWTRKYHDQNEKENVYSMSLNGMDNVRAVLWPMEEATEAEEWAAMISIAVGEDGEFPITGDIITRWNGDEWRLSTFRHMSKRIEEVRTQVRRWDFELALPLVDKAMMSLALRYNREGNGRVCSSILLTALRGEVSMATISESLSIVQLKHCKTREERLRSAKIWSKIFS